jgi:hypothetical protein
VGETRIPSTDNRPSGKPCPTLIAVPSAVTSLPARTRRHPSVVRIVWPTAATFTTPARYLEVAGTAMRILAEASTTLAKDQSEPPALTGFDTAADFHTLDARRNDDRRRDGAVDHDRMGTWGQRVQKRDPAVPDGKA